MKTSSTLFERYRLFLISPWLSASAIGLLVLIIVAFAASNMQREKKHLTETLLRKGLDLATFVMAGTRAPAMTGIPVRAQVQSLIQEAAVAGDIHSIAVIDDTGKILAHSDPNKVETKIGRDTADLAVLAAGARGRMTPAADGDGKGQVFEVVVAFEPFRMMHRGRRMGTAPQETSPEDGKNLPSEQPLPCPMQDPPPEGGKTPPPPPAPSFEMQGEWCWNWNRGQDPFAQIRHLIVIELETADLQRAVRQTHTQILILSVTLLLVGLAGWVSLLTVQGYRVNRETLKRMEAFTDLLVSRLPVGVIATDHSGTLLTVNLAAGDMLGLDVTACMGNKPADVLPQDLSRYLLADSASGMEDKLIFRHPEGDELHLHLSAAPIVDRDGQTTGRVLLLHNLTNIHRLEEGMRRHDRFVALGKMAAGVAHEVRNPLSSIKGFATLLGSKFDAGSEEEELSRLLITEVERLNRSITALLDYARPLPLARKPTDVKLLIENAVRLMQADAQAAGVTFRTEFGKNLPEVVPLDADRINQVLLNLFLNALQAMPGGGLLEVVASLAGEDSIEIVVKDTGCGIPEENLSRILDPYFTTKPNGTGLGLAMVNKIIEEHGGNISFESLMDRGTTVMVRLPIAAR